MGVHAVEKRQLSAKGMLARIHSVFGDIKESVKDPRGKKSKISLVDSLMSALAVFGLKFSSLLQLDDSREEETIRHNLRTLYYVENALCDTYMREKLDDLNPRDISKKWTMSLREWKNMISHLKPVFVCAFKGSHPKALFKENRCFNCSHFNLSSSYSSQC